MKFELSKSEAIYYCITLASAYVGVLYLVPSSIHNLPRDHPRRIYSRFLAVSLLCCCCPYFMYYFSVKSSSSEMEFWQWLGFRKNGFLMACTLPIFLSSTLFLGPILGKLLHLRYKKYRHKVVFHSLVDILKLSATYQLASEQPLPALRTWIVGPLTEEFVFRSCMLPILAGSGFSLVSIIFLSPLVFGIAHIHHAIDHLRQGRSKEEVLLILMLQLCYTTVFGIFENFLFMRTGHFVSIFLVHVFCNILGLPEISFLKEWHPLYEHRYSIMVGYGIGVVGFIVFLFPFTNPQLYDSLHWNTIGIN